MAEAFVQWFIAGLMAIYGLVYLIGGIEAAQVHVVRREPWLAVLILLLSGATSGICAWTVWMVLQ